MGEGEFTVVLLASALGLPELFALLVITQVKRFLYVFFIFYLQNKNKVAALQLSDGGRNARAAACGGGSERAARAAASEPPKRCARVFLSNAAKAPLAGEGLVWGKKQRCSMWLVWLESLLE